MRHFFKFIAVFLPFSFTLLSEEEIEIVKVEVATVIWKDQATSEKFEIVDELDDWSRVVLPDGKDGWIENEHFRRIN